MLDVVNGLSFIVDDDVIKWSLCVQLYADFVNNI